MAIKLSKETLSVRLRDDIDRKVRQIADDEGNTASAVARRLISQGLANDAAGSPDRRPAA